MKEFKKESLFLRKLERLKSIYPEVENIKNLEDTLREDPNKLSELPVAVRFLRHYSEAQNGSYVLSVGQPS